MKNHYKEKYWDYSNDELKDIIAGRFSLHSEDEIAAALELLSDRRHRPASEDADLSLAQIPSASMQVLLEIVKNPQLWSKDAVEIAEAEILRREKQPASANNQTSPIMKGIMAIAGIIGAIIFVKLMAVLIFLAFLFYSVHTCLNDLN